MIKVTLRGFEEGEKSFRNASRAAKACIQTELENFGKEKVEWLQNSIRKGGLGVLPKARDDGHPPLVNLGAYADSYAAVVQGNSLLIGAFGENENMSNSALGELLEYGAPRAGIPARPHLRPLEAVTARDAPKLGERIANGLLRRT